MRQQTLNILIVLLLSCFGAMSFASTQSLDSTEVEQQYKSLPGTVAARLGEYWIEPRACETARSVSFVYTHPFGNYGLLISLYEVSEDGDEFAFWRAKTLSKTHAKQELDGYAEHIMRTYTREMQPEDFEQLVSGIDFSRVISIEDTRGQSLALDGYNLAASISLCEVNGLIYSNENDDDFTFIKSAFDPILQEAITTIPELESISKLALPE